MKTDAKRNYTKKELAKELKISQPTLNAHLKKAGLESVKVNKKTYHDIYEKLSGKEINDTNRKTIAMPLTNFDSLYKLPPFKSTTEEFDKVILNLIDKYNYYEHYIRRIEREIKTIELKADTLYDSKFLREEHMKLQNAQLKVIRMITDLSGKLIPVKEEEKTEETVLNSIEDSI